MRTLTDHKVNGLNEALDITVLDEPGQGNANHVYRIESLSDAARARQHAADAREHGWDACAEALDELAAKSKDGTPQSLFISFQNGPIQEAGVNGISNESLLAVVIDRLRGFQSGQYACRENALALTKLEEATMWLQKRTRDRVARGVEGTNQK